MTTMRRLATTATLLATLLPLAACGEDEKPRPPIVNSTSPTPTPTQSATVPVEETPEDFIRRWVEVSNETQLSGDTSDYLALASNCVTCTKFAELVTSIYRDGGYVRTDGWQITRIELDPASDQVRPNYFLTVDSAPTTLKKSATAQEERIKGGRSRHRLELIRKDGAWKLTLLHELAS